MLPYEFWRLWLFWASIAVVIFSLLLAVATPIGVLPIYHRAINQALWNTDKLPVDVTTFHHFMFGVLGATMASQAVLQAFIAGTAFKKRERWAWWAVFASMAVWFPLDTALSLYWGAWPNAVFNMAALLMVALPLAGTYNGCHQRPTARDS